MGRAKYNTRKHQYDGLTFDSRPELARYKALKLLDAAGEISDLVVHPKFELQPAFDYHGERVRAITYTADFEYMDKQTGELVIEDVKPWIWNKKRRPPKYEPLLTEDFQLKRKMFMFQYPDCVFRIVEA